jgi:two-component system cell cycle sensor histidine kinase/response regulator CckA
LTQILLNLIINARDALQQKLAEAPGEGWTPRIVVRATEKPPSARTPRPQNDQRELLGWQVLTVQDNGPGIPPSIRDRIFEPFFTTKDVGHGTGIGLATVWQLVTVAGGTITVESRVGEGTAFHVVLPRRQRQASMRPSSKPPPVIGEGPKLRVFVAEDERLLARACVRSLVSLGHQVTHVKDGLDAWTAFEKGAGDTHDILLTDVNMPRMGGLDLIRRIRTTGFRGRVIVMSGRVDSVSSDTINTLQLDYVLAKPFNIDELLNAVADGRPKSSPPSS